MCAESPIVDEVRSRRSEISKQFDDDVEAYARHLMEYQRRYADRLVDQVTVVRTSHSRDQGTQDAS